MLLKCKRHTLLGVLTLVLIMSTNVRAKSLAITGEVETRAPTVNINLPAGDIVSRVKTFNSDATFLHSGCVVTAQQSDALIATQIGSQTCYFKYDYIDDGLVIDGANLNGYLQNNGSQDINHSIYFYSGSAKEEILIATGSKGFNVLEPVAPVFISYRTKWGPLWEDGLTPVNHNRLHYWEQLQVFVEPRNYDQKIFIPSLDQSCTVAEGLTQCSIGLIEGIPLAEDTTIETGSENEIFALNSKNEIFINGVDGTLEKTLIKNWDYRTPNVANTEYKVVNKPDDVIKQMNADGSTITLFNNQMVVEVRTPHINKPGTWWKPAEARLVLTSDEDNAQTKGVTVDGNVLFTKPAPIINGVFEIVESAPIQYGDAFVYTFDLTTVPDGIYLPSIEVKDSYNNLKIESKPDVNFARALPVIKLFHDYKPVIEGEKTYFVEQLIAAVHNGYDDQVSIRNVTINGETMALEGSYDDYKWLNPNGIEYAPQSELFVSIEAEDTAGNIITKDYKLDYMPVEFAMPRLGEQAYEDIQMLDFTLTQLEGRNCEVYPTHEEAMSRAITGYMACAFEWVNLPEGIEPDFESSVPKAIGVLANVGFHDVQYRVYAYNSKGVMNIAADNSKQIEALEVPVPEVNVTNAVVTSDNVYPIGIKGGRFATAKFSSVTGEVDAYYKDEDGAEFEEKHVKQSNSSDRLTYILKMNSLPGNLWESRQYEIGASFVRSPLVKTTKYIDTVFVPSKSIKAYMSVEGKYGVSTEKMPAKVSVGIYNRSTRSVLHDKSTMGEWNVVIVTEDADGEIIPLTETVVVDEFGNADLHIDMSIVNKRGANVYAIASLVSQLANYEHSVESQGRYYRIMKGEEVVGGLKYRTITAIPPFTASFRYTPEGKQDNESLGSVLWEVSDDGGSSWYPQGVASRNKGFTYRAEEVGEWLVRAKATNAFTSAESYTETVKITAYNRPKIKIAGPTMLLTGQNAVYTINDEYTEASENDFYEWSFDEGETWDAGLRSYELTDAKVSTVLQARMKYLQTGDDAGAKGWGSTKYRISVKEPKSPRISATIPRLVEAGFEYELKANSRSPYSGLVQEVMYEWVLPNGDVSNEKIVKYTPSDDDINDKEVKMTLTAWLDGYKEATSVTKAITTKAWKYSFPDYTLAIREGVKYAPASVTAYIQSPRVYAPGVQFNYNWIFDENVVELVYAKGDKAKFAIIEPGVHQIEVEITDNRNNSVILNSFVEALPLEPIEMNPKVVLSNEYQRFPVDVSIRLSTRLTHPDDRVVKYDWYLDDVLQHDIDAGKYKHLYDEIPEGMHQFKIVVTTLFGQVGEEIYDFEVVPNQPPTCTASLNRLSTYSRVTTSCNDADGSMAAYQWFVDGEPRNIWSRSMSISNSPDDVEIYVKGFDDSGDFAEVTVIIPGTP